MLRRRRAISEHEAPDEATAVVRVHIVAGELLNPVAAVDESAGNRAAKGVVVRQHWKREARLIARAGVEASSPFHDWPTVVLAGRHGTGLYVHLLLGILAHVGDVEVIRLRVERVPPRITQSILPDLPPRSQLANEGVVCWDSVWTARIDIDPQDLPVEGAQVLSVC